MSAVCIFLRAELRRRWLSRQNSAESTDYGALRAVGMSRRRLMAVGTGLFPG